MSTEFDPVQYKSGQRQEWDTAAFGWNKWWSIFGGDAQVLSDRMLELAQIEPGHSVLDIATGTGEPATTAARRVGPSGRITAIDQSTNMLDIARERAAELGLQNMEFLEMDAEALKLPEESFHGVLCRWGLMFLPDLKGTLEQIHRVLKADGRFAAAVWAGPEEVPSLSIPMAVVRQMIDVPPPPPAEAPGVFSLADAANLERAYTDAGFSSVRSERMIVPFNYASADEYVQVLKESAAPVNDILAGLQEEVWEAIKDAAGKFADSDGRISMPNQCILVVGRRA